MCGPQIDNRRHLALYEQVGATVAYLLNFWKRALPEADGSI